MEVIRPLAARRDVFGNFPSSLSVSFFLAMLAKSSCERVADTYRILDRYSKEPYSGVSEWEWPWPHQYFNKKWRVYYFLLFTWTRSCYRTWAVEIEPFEMT